MKRLSKMEKQLEDYNNFIPTLEDYKKRFLKEFEFFKYCPQNDLNRLFDWFRRNPINEGWK